jgi:hypothetical protein
MTDLEKALAEGGEVVAGGGGKYPQPRSMTAGDAELGMRSGPITVPVEERLLRRIAGGDPAGEQELGPEEDKAKRAADAEVASGVMRDLGFSFVGGQLGRAAAAGLTGRFAAKAAPALAGTFGEMKAAPAVIAAARPTFRELAQKAINNTASHVVAGSVLGSMSHHPVLGPAVGALVGVAAKPVATAVAKGAIPAVAAALPAAGAAGAPAMSNAIDRLRASAAGNPRAADLLARIQAAKFEPPDTVTQGTLGNP